MLDGLFIFVDDDFADPLYADPAPGDVDPDLWQKLCSAVDDAIEGDGKAEGHEHIQEWHIAWRFNSKLGLSFAAIVTDDVRPKLIHRFLSALDRRYVDEVDDPREPERAGVADVVADVVPPWEDGEDDDD